MPKEVVQTRVDRLIKDELEEKAETEGKNLSEVVREILEAEVGADQNEFDLREKLYADIASIGLEGGSNEILTPLAANWDAIAESGSAAREDVLETTGTVYLSAQGSSLTVAKWLANRLREDFRIKSTASAAEQLSLSVVDENDLLVFLSCSGETESITKLAKRAVDVPADTVAFTSPKSELDSDVDLTVPVYPAPQHLTNYSIQKVITQMLVIQEILYSEDHSHEAIRTRLEAVSDFIDEQLDVENKEIDAESPLLGAVERLEKEGDLKLQPIVSTLGRYHPLGREVVQKHTEILHDSPAYTDLGSVRDRLINVLYDGEGYLFSILPPESTPAYDACGEYLSRDENSITSLLKLNEDPEDLRILTVSFDRDDSYLERHIAEMSKYGRDGTILLEDRGELENDLIVLVSTFIFILASLDKRWKTEENIRQTVIRKVWSGPA